MNLLNLIAGISIIFLSTMYLIYIIKTGMKDKNYNSFTRSYDIKIVGGIIIFIIGGIILIYKELKYLF